ncbi:hypothetical protein BMS3Bbin02_01967 [bacterium BMS3Bbin02]|nr:hypothetical protein BMS3Bbin02_01967 [bacterium BMS3Bbin02]
MKYTAPAAVKTQLQGALDGEMHHGSMMPHHDG